MTTVQQQRAALDTLCQQHDHLTDAQVASLARSVAEALGSVKTARGIIARLDPRKAGSFSWGYNRADMLSLDRDEAAVLEAAAVLREGRP